MPCQPTEPSPMFTTKQLHHPSSSHPSIPVLQESLIWMPKDSTLISKPNSRGIPFPPNHLSIQSDPNWPLTLMVYFTTLVRFMSWTPKLWITPGRHFSQTKHSTKSSNTTTGQTSCLCQGLTADCVTICSHAKPVHHKLMTSQANSILRSLEFNLPWDFIEKLHPIQVTPQF